MRVLVTGGTGYIGSHTAVCLIEAGHDVVVVDNLANSSITAVDRIGRITGTKPRFIRLDLLDRATVDRLFRTGAFDGVIHFAGLKAVADSVRDPLRYYDVNLGSTQSVASAAVRHGVSRFVFSSSSTVYGSGARLPHGEDSAGLGPVNPYGWTKLMSERVLADTAEATHLRVINLRYFNPVGAHRSGLLGESPLGAPSNLMPLISDVALGRRPSLQIFGNDYPTSDGTCVRDYIHVDDLAAGHVRALEHFELMSDPVREFNLGTGTGTSVLELVATFEQVTGACVPIELAGRRAGDTALSWADVSRARRELGWTATRSVRDACEDNWRWLQHERRTARRPTPRRRANLIAT